MSQRIIDELNAMQDKIDEIDREIEAQKLPLDYARRASDSIPCEIDKGKGGLIGRLTRWLNQPMEV